jgi:hypothetical protein
LLYYQVCRSLETDALAKRNTGLAEHLRGPTLEMLVAAQ